MKMKLIGMSKFRGKDGRQWGNIFFNAPFPQGSDGVGTNVISVMIPGSRYGIVTPEMVGKEVKPEYGFNDFGKPELIGLSL